jgi:hypothetical protein
MRPRKIRIAVLAALAGAPFAGATTIVPLTFEELVRQAGVVVEGTVIDMQVGTRGADLAPAAAPEGAGGPGAPRGVGVEGTGRMLFTEVTLAVETEIVGSAGPEVRFFLAGGADGGERAIVFGMPQFEIGGRYVVFLRPDFEATNVPLVGVHQGFFERVQDPRSGRDALIDAAGDFVLGIEGGRVALRHNPERASRAAPRLAPPPVPEPGSAVETRLSPEVERYYSSPEPPMPPEEFFAAVRTVKGGQP